MSGERAPSREDAVGAVLLAAGSGRRFGAKKQFLELGDRPLFLWALDALAAATSELVLVTPAEDSERVERLLSSAGRDARVVAGGARRQDSVKSGLEALDDRIEWAVVHDAARPFVTSSDIERFVARMIEVGGAAIGHPSSDSVKEAREGADERALVTRNLPRERVWLVQTPQGARRTRLLDAIAEADRRGITVTDEASALELLGDDVALVEGPRSNLKVTHPDDLELARFLVARSLDKPHAE